MIFLLLGESLGDFIVPYLDAILSGDFLGDLHTWGVPMDFVVIIFAEFFS